MYIVERGPLAGPEYLRLCVDDGDHHWSWTTELDRATRFETHEAATMAATETGSEEVRVVEDEE